MTLTDGALYDDYEQKCDECRRLRAEVERLKKALTLDRTVWLRFDDDLAIKKMSEGDGLEIMFGQLPKDSKIIVVKRPKMAKELTSSERNEDK